MAEIVREQSDVPARIGPTQPIAHALQSVSGVLALVPVIETPGLARSALVDDLIVARGTHIDRAPVAEVVVIAHDEVEAGEDPRSEICESRVLNEFDFPYIVGVETEAAALRHRDERLSQRIESGVLRRGDR